MRLAFEIVGLIAVGTLLPAALTILFDLHWPFTFLAGIVCGAPAGALISIRLHADRGRLT